MINLELYKSNLGIFLKTQYGVDQINGIAIKSFPLNAGYYFLEGIHEITSVCRVQMGSQKIVGYELITPSLASDSIPINLTCSQVNLTYSHDDDEYLLGAEFGHIASLYKEVQIKTESRMVEEPFTIKVIRTVEIENYSAPQKMQVIGALGANQSQTVDLSYIVSYEDIERTLTPEFLLHDRPCTISSEIVYKIIRAHIKQNINSAVAQVTSDYDFCFTVQRRTKTKPTVHSSEKKKANGKSYATPVFVRRTTDEKLLPLFNMAPKKYQDYNAVAAWSADSLADMYEQIGVYLGVLMEEINKPTEECSHCAGHGIIHHTLSLPVSTS